MAYNQAIQTSLFGDMDFMDIKFPKPQYLGAKYIHGDWIATHTSFLGRVRNRTRAYFVPN